MTELLTTPPDQAEALFLGAGLVSAICPTGCELSNLQRLLIASLVKAMTGYAFDPATAPRMSGDEFAAGLTRRDEIFRHRVMQTAILAALVEHPVSRPGVQNVAVFCNALGVSDETLCLADELASGSKSMVLTDFNRSGYTHGLTEDARAALHAHAELTEVWAADTDDPELAAQWAALERCPEGSLGLGVWRFYHARGFRYPGSPGSAPPYLAQHDWVHVLADYGSTVESELEVFSFIGRATDDPRGFALLAMVVGLFETGDIPAAAGLFQADPGHLSRTAGMTQRMADAMRRGALTNGDQRFMERDWFLEADRPLEDVRADVGIVPKSAEAVSAGSVGPFDPGSLSPYQWQAGIELAAEQGREHRTWGATVAAPSG